MIREGGLSKSAALVGTSIFGGALQMRLSASKAWLVLLASASVRLDMRGIGRAGGRKSGLASACLTCPGRVRRVYGLADRFRKLGRQVINAAGQAGKGDAAEQDGSTECCRKEFFDG